MTKVKCVVIDTLTSPQNDEILSKWSKGKASHDDWKDYGVDIVKNVKLLNKLGFEPVGVLGYEGTGKSFGMRNLKEGECIWYNLDRKNPTWKGGREIFGTKNNPTKYQVQLDTLDDVTAHLMELKSKGVLEDDLVVFLLGHLEDYKSADGVVRQRLKTMGKLSKGMGLEGELNIVYYTEVKKVGNQVEYLLNTQNSGFNTCRSYEGLHDSAYIPNDFSLILEAIKNY